jgi:peptidoglycan/xylan/chitin deacetylase (PgdA/CDA1 family)
MKKRVTHLFLLIITWSLISCASRPAPIAGTEAELPQELSGPSETGLSPEEAEPILSIEADDSGILLAFDDTYEKSWEEHFALLDRYGVRATFFVQGNFSPFCTTAMARGHEIGYHTKNHLNLLRVSRRVFFEETIQDIEAFRQEGLPLKAFAYPYGFSEPWMHEALAGTFSILRGFGAACRIYTVDTIKKGYISSKSIDNIMYQNDEAFEDDISAMLRTVKFTGGILPLTSHAIAEDASWGISPKRLEYLLKTATDLKLKFYRYGDFFI